MLTSAAPVDALTATPLDTFWNHENFGAVVGVDGGIPYQDGTEPEVVTRPCICAPGFQSPVTIVTRKA